MGRPRLLFLAHRIPYPPDKGEKIRAWHMLERRVSPTAANEFLAEHEAPVPGCKHDRAHVVQIRRSNEK